ncbi:MAG TPA: bifunctional phosphoserine phosphatase/homoserine phosphotransferase ThrH [Bacteroidales bacterium]|nr:bifunctional phosphoserine phosphatase/homoserine phosphotransferase ThrH [Bacteroidales bacterium]
MNMVCFDMEGVFTPEIWINVARKTGIDALKITTRDEPDYDKLMKYRIGILEEHGITLAYIQEVIASLDLLEGARDFFDRVRKLSQAIVVTDSFVEFAMPFIRKLGDPLVLCHHLLVDERNMITGYRLRQPDPKRKVVEAFQFLKYQVIGIGDSYNDMGMIQQADKGILFRPPDNVIRDYPQFPVCSNYAELEAQIRSGLNL